MLNNFIKIASWTFRSGPEQLDRVRTRLEVECQETALNNYHSAAGEFLFRFSKPSHTRVLAGPGSASKFRGVLADRLAEYARNLQWLRANRNYTLAKETAAFLKAVASLRPFLPTPLHLRKALKALRNDAV